MPIYFVSLFTYPFGLEREVFKWEAHLNKKLTSNGSVEQSGWIRETERKKPASFTPINSGVSWVVNRRSTDEELQKFFSQYLTSSKVLIPVPVDFFSHRMCFENMTYYQIPNKLFGKFLSSKVPQTVDRLKFEITLPSSKELLQPNQTICLEPDGRFYLAEVTTDVEQTIKDIKELGYNDVLESVIQLRFYERPKYSFMPIIVWLVMYWSWFHILFLIKKIWKEFVK